MALSEKIKEIIGALTDSLNPMGEEQYEDNLKVVLKQLTQPKKMQR